jgi:hypothetical protein
MRAEGDTDAHQNDRGDITLASGLAPDKCSGELLTAPPPAEKNTACQD